MIIAIACTGNTIDDIVDSRFGRCSYFAFYNSDTEEIEFIKNPFKENGSRAGLLSGRFIRSHHATKVIAGDYGIKVKAYMDKYQIQMIVIFEEKSVRQVVEYLQKKK